MCADKQQPRQGVKVDQSLTKDLDSSKIASQQAEPDEEVSGQYYYNGWTQCPYCGNVGWTNGLNTNFYITVVCGRCGSLFLA